VDRSEVGIERMPGVGCMEALDHLLWGTITPNARKAPDAEDGPA
jgi:hypothetical protein